MYVCMHVYMRSASGIIAVALAGAMIIRREKVPSESWPVKCIYIYVCMYVYMYVCMYVCMYVYMRSASGIIAVALAGDMIIRREKVSRESWPVCICVYVCMRVCVCVCMYACQVIIIRREKVLDYYVRMYVCMCVYVCMYVKSLGERKCMENLGVYVCESTSQEMYTC